MYGDSKQKSTSRSKKEHKFFERQIDINNINSLEKVLLFNYKKIGRAHV